MIALRVGFTAILLGLLIYSFLTSRNWSGTARLFPWSVTTAAMILVAIQLWFDIVGIRSRETADQEEARGMDLTPDADLPPTEVLRRALGVLLWLVALFAAVVLFGFRLGVPGFVFVFLLWSREKPLVAVAFALGMAAFTIGIFDLLLRVPWLPPLILDLFK